MGKEQHIDNDIDNKEREDNDIDNDRETESLIRKFVVENISEYRLQNAQEFLYKDYCFGSSKDFINPALLQMDRFIYMWYSEIGELDRKTIIEMMLEYDGDGRTRAYKDYTGSPLWKYTSSVIKTSRHFTCERCGIKLPPTGLVVHHKTYEHLGSELEYQEDLQLLCKQCHMDIHGIRRTK